MIPLRPLGPTGVHVPVIGQGTWNLGVGRRGGEEEIAALRRGLDLGMTHIDTAEMYGDGRTEELVARAIGGRRHEVFLVSKVLPSNASYKGTVQACERSLRRLRTDVMDLYLLHWPGRHPIEETMRAMEDLVVQGRIRFVGVSNFDADQTRRAQAALTRERLACNQVPYHIKERGIEYSLIPYCEREGIAVVGYSPFGQGDFPSPQSRGGKALAEIGRKHGRTVRQVVLNFLTRRLALFTIPKAAQAVHVEENAGGAGWELDAADLSAIDQVFPPPGRETPLAML